MTDIQKISEATHAIDVFYGALNAAAVYVIRDGDEVALIDAGTALSPPHILKGLEKLGIAPEQVRYILPTHVHLDHAGGVAPLSKICVNASVYIHPRGIRHLIDPTKLIEGSLLVYGKEVMERDIGQIIPLPSEKAHEAEDGMLLPLGNRQLRIVFSPGHAKHHYSVWDETSGCYFAGDVAGNSYREMDKNNQHMMFLCSAPVQFEPDDWSKSLEDIRKIAPKTICLCHFSAITNVNQALDDLQRLIKEHCSAVMASPANNFEDIQKIVWELFQKDFERFKPPISWSEAEKKMMKDVYIATGGLHHWKQQQLKQ